MPNWGKINSGQSYGLLCDDVARRLATLEFGKVEHLLINFVREHSWARSTRRKSRDGVWPDPIPVRINVLDLTRELCGPDIGPDRKEFRTIRTRLHEAVQKLKADRILVVVDPAEGTMTINTDVDAWQTEGREILPDGRGLAYALAAQNPRDGRPDADADLRPELANQVRRDDISGITVERNDRPSITVERNPITVERNFITVNRNPITVERNPQYIGPRASEDLIQINSDEVVVVASATTPTRDDDDGPAPILGEDPGRSGPVPPTSVPDPSPVPTSPADAERERVLAELRRDVSALILKHPAGNDFVVANFAMSLRSWLDEGFTPSQIASAVGGLLTDSRKIPTRSWASYCHHAMAGLRVRTKTTVDGVESKSRVPNGVRTPDFPVVQPSEQSRRMSELRARPPAPRPAKSRLPIPKPNEASP